MSNFNFFNKTFNMSMSPLEQFSVSKTSISIFPSFKFEIDNNFSLFSLSCNENHLLWSGDTFITDSEGIILPSLGNFFTNISFFFVILFFFAKAAKFLDDSIVFIKDFSTVFLFTFIHIFTGLFFIVFFHNETYFQEVYVTDSLEILPTLFTQSYVNFFFTLEDIFWAILIGFSIGTVSENDNSENVFLHDDISVIEYVLPTIFLDIFDANSEENAALYLKISTVSSFAFYSNLTGVIPYADTLTSSFVVTFGVALMVFSSLVYILLRRNGVNYFFGHFLPAGCPLILIFLLIPIEVISYSFRLVSLAVRLFANMMAGHTLMKTIAKAALDCLLTGVDILILCAYIPLMLLFMLLLLEIAVAFIQAYIFTLLICLYLREVLPK